MLFPSRGLVIFFNLWKILYFKDFFFSSSSNSFYLIQCLWNIHLEPSDRGFLLYNLLEIL